VQVYKPPVDEYRFLFETFGYDAIHALPGYEDYDLETVMSLVEQAGTFAKEKLLPLNRTGDHHGVKLDAKTHSVTTAPGFDAAYKELQSGGYLGLTHSPDHGGSGAPELLTVPFNEFFCAANKAFSMCPGLTHGLIEALAAHGSDALKERFLGKLVSGEWAGTMCLTEPQCGTDLGMLTTKAEPSGDHHLITGTKIWITFGDQDITSNIVHLVLARLPDAPPGIKGISVFLVPKWNDDGSRNPAFCTGLEHKMGIHASPTCVMSFEGAKGYLVGEPHKGMRAMFTMMNAARLLVGIEGLALSEIAYQTALAFAQDRRQGRSLDTSKNEPAAAADNILVHPDVRRMLLEVKSTNMAMRGLAVWVGGLIDRSHKHADPEVRQQADDLVALMTPIIKSFCTERGFANISTSMQVMGGSGYTVDWSVEQYLRDARIALIYEGTNHIQALDLVGRKLPKDGGRLYRAFTEHVNAFLAREEKNPAIAALTDDVKGAMAVLDEATMGLAMKGMADGEEAAAVASPYLNLFGMVALSFVWFEMLVHAAKSGDGSLATRQKFATYYVKHVLPEVHTLKTVIAEGKQHMMAVEAGEL